MESRNKENSSNTLGNKAAAPVLQEVSSTPGMKKASRPSTITRSTSKVNDNQLKVQLIESEKQVKSLTQKLSKAESQLTDASIAHEKAKIIEKEFNKLLSAQSTNDRKQNTKLKQAQNQIHSLAKKDNDRKRRKELQHDQLREELERIEDSYEKQVVDLKHELTTIQLQSETEKTDHKQEILSKSQELVTLKTTCEETKIELLNTKEEVSQLSTALTVSQEALVTSQTKEAEHEITLQQLHFEAIDLLSKAKETDALLLSERMTNKEQNDTMLKEHESVLEALHSELTVQGENLTSALTANKELHIQKEEEISTLEAVKEQLMETTTTQSATIVTLEATLTDSKQELFALNTCHATLTEEYASIQKSLENTETSLTEASKRAREVETELFKSTVQNEQLQSNCNHLKDSLKISETSLLISTDSLAESESNIVALKESINNTCAAHVIELATRDTQIQTVEQTLSTLKCDHEAMSTECCSLKESLEASVTKSNELEAQMAKRATVNSAVMETLKGKITSAEEALSSERVNNKEQVNALTENFTNQIKTMENELNTTQQALQESVTAHDDLKRNSKQQIQSLAEEKTKLTGVVAAQTAAITSKQVDLEKNFQNLSTLQSKHDLLIEANDDLKEKFTQCQSDLEASVTQTGELEAQMTKRASVNSAVMETLKGKITSAEEALSSERVTNKEQVNTLTEKCDSLLTEKAHLLAINTTQIASIASLEAKCDASEQSIVSLTAEYQALKIESDGFMASLESVEKEFTMAAQGLTRMETEVSKLTTENTELLTITKTLEQQVVEKKNELQIIQTESTGFEHQVVNLSSENTSLCAEVSQLNEVVSSKVSEITNKEVEISSLMNNMTQLQNSNISLQQETESDKVEACRLQSELNCAQRLLQTKMAEITELSTATSVVPSLQQQLEATNTEKFHIIKELTQARDQVAQYKLSIQSNEEEKNEIKKMKSELHLKESRINEANRKIFLLEESITDMNDLKIAKNQLQDKYNAVLLEQEGLLLGSSNKNKKFKFIQDLKVQVQELSEENTRLRSLKK